MSVPWNGWLHLDGWGGYSKQAIIVVRETSARYEITPAGKETVKLAGRYRWLLPGKMVLVPKRAVTQRTDG